MNKVIVCACLVFVASSSSLLAEEDTPPTLTPPDWQVVPVSESSEENLVFTASGGIVSSTPSDYTSCPPWVPTDYSYYHWTLPESDSSRVVAGGTAEDDYVELAVNTAGMGEIGVELMKEFSDDSRETLYAEVSSGATSVPYDVVKVEIQGNDTEEGDDDLVREKATLPGGTEKAWDYPCRARLTQASSADIAVTLTSDNGKLRFKEGAESADITLPMNGDWLAFPVSGHARSSSKDDTLVEARLGSAEGKIAGTDDYTVFYFEPNDMTVAQGGNYALEYNQLTEEGIFDSVGHPGVRFVATARLKPDELSLSGPHLENLKVGICQNSVQNATIKIVYGSPQVTWTGVRTGVVVMADEKYQDTITVPGANNDSDAGSNPLYDKAIEFPKSVALPRVDAESDEKAEASDTPSAVVPAYLYTNARDSVTNAVVGQLRYEVESVEINMDFKTWCVTFMDDSTKEIIPLRETSWSCKVKESISGGGNKKCTVPSGDKAVSSMPVAGGPYQRDELDKIANKYKGPEGTNKNSIPYPNTTPTP